MTESEKPVTRVAFLGNSIQYFNDLPRFMSALSKNAIQQNSCFRGGANFKTLFKNGNGMQVKFSTTNALQAEETKDIGAPDIKSLILQEPWDFIVMNDFTQHPARNCTRLESIATLVEDYAPLIRQSGGTVVFLMTYAYRKEGLIEGSEDLGTVAQFTNLLHKGYQTYSQALADVLLSSSPSPRIAPVGLAFFMVHEENPDMWSHLYHPDSKHPSPHGTFLIGCVLYYTIFGIPPTKEIAIPEGGPESLWEKARLMQPAGDNPQSKPNKAQAEYLLDVATRVCLNYVSR